MFPELPQEFIDAVAEFRAASEQLSDMEQSLDNGDLGYAQVGTQCAALHDKVEQHRTTVSTLHSALPEKTRDLYPLAPIIRRRYTPFVYDSSSGSDSDDDVVPLNVASEKKSPADKVEPVSIPDVTPTSSPANMSQDLPQAFLDAVAELHSFRKQLSDIQDSIGNGRVGHNLHEQVQQFHALQHQIKQHVLKVSAMHSGLPMNARILHPITDIISWFNDSDSDNDDDAAPTNDSAVSDPTPQLEPLDTAPEKNTPGDTVKFVSVSVHPSDEMKLQKECADALYNLAWFEQELKDYQTEHPEEQAAIERMQDTRDSFQADVDSLRKKLKDEYNITDTLAMFNTHTDSASPETRAYNNAYEFYKGFVDLYSILDNSEEVVPHIVSAYADLQRAYKSLPEHAKSIKKFYNPLRMLRAARNPSNSQNIQL